MILRGEGMSRKPGMAFASLREDDSEWADLEKHMNVGFVDNHDEPWPHFRDKLVEMFIGNVSVRGVYRGITNGDEAILFPHLIYEPIPLEDGKHRDFYRWDDEEPSHIGRHTIGGIRGANPDYVRYLLKMNKPQLWVPPTWSS